MQAGAARRSAAEWAQQGGWDEPMRGRLALVITELGNNLALHTTDGGSLLLREVHCAPARGVEITSLDRGPGVENFNHCLRDGFSTAGTPGTGLGAVSRASESFLFYSQPGSGTILVSELWEKANIARVAGRWEVGAVCVPAPGEEVCGDAWAEVRPHPAVFRLIVGDGLGHGPFAEQASVRAAEIFTKHPELDLPAVLKLIHEGLRSTRGAAVAIAEIDLARQQVTYAGVGNIAASIVAEGKSTSLVSMNGTLGTGQPSFRSFTYAWPEGAVLVMMSDGIKSHWQLDRYASLGDRAASLLAGALYRDHVRGKDDATVVVVREHQ